MISPVSRHRLALLAIGLIVLLGPLVILALTLGALVLFGDLALGRVTLVEFLELYIIDLILFIGLAYGIYRLIFWLVEHQLPTSIDYLEARDADESSDTKSRTTEDQ